MIQSKAIVASDEGKDSGCFIVVGRFPGFQDHDSLPEAIEKVQKWG
ncbi:MAG: hypothetical protein JW866_04160 [Ignavibacteriales bacterium]|nr:hypothetical protein [Ignavibacteriales bacterium]